MSDHGLVGLLVRDTGEQWRRGHNDAVLAAMPGGRPDTLLPAEAGILALAGGLAGLVDTWTVLGKADPLSGRYMHDLLTGFTGLLAYDVGRLDPGVLSDWARELAERWGIDPDTGHWKGGA